MNKLLRGVFFAAGLACAAAAHGAAYKCVDDNGRTVYSDIPCMKKPAPPAAKAEPAVPAAKPAEPVPTKITEADVIRVLDQMDEYVRRNNHADQCNMLAESFKFKTTIQPVQAGSTPKVLQGGRSESCVQMREGAELFKRGSVVPQTTRGPVKVVMEAGDTRASVAYDAVINMTKYDRVMMTMRCSSRAQLALTDGKLLFVMMEDSCK